MTKQKVIDRETYCAINMMSCEEIQAFLMCYAERALEDNGKLTDLCDRE